MQPVSLVADIALCQEKHLSEDIDVHLLCDCLEKFPDVTISFIMNHFCLLPAGDPAVRGGCDRVRLNNERIIIGSKVRSPKMFWKDHLYGRNEEMEEVDEEERKMRSYNRTRLAHRRPFYFPGTKYELWGQTEIIRRWESASGVETKWEST